MNRTAALMHRWSARNASLLRAARRVRGLQFCAIENDIPVDHAISEA